MYIGSKINEFERKKLEKNKKIPKPQNPKTPKPQRHFLFDREWKDLISH